MKLTFTRVLQWTVVVFIVVLVVAEALVYVPPLKESQTVSVTFQSSPGKVSIQSTLWSSFTGTYRQAVDWINGTSSVRTLYYFYDSHYGVSYSNIVSWYGVPLYLSLLMSSRDLPISVVVVNATELATVLTNSSTAVGSLLVVASGAFPSTVYTSTTDFVKPWLEEGGRLVWIGDAIGYYSALPGQALSDTNVNPGIPGVVSLLGLRNFSSPPAYPNPTPVSSAINLDWLTDALPRYGLNVSEVVANHGVVEGNLLDGSTNAALVRVGSGAILDIASPLTYGIEQRFAVAIVNMIQLGLLFPSTGFVSVASQVVSGGSSVTWSATATPGVPGTGNSWSVCAFTQQVDLGALFGSSSCQSGYPAP